jgi:DNA polymerase-1
MSQETDTPTERVFLIDAMSHIFRAYFAPVGMRAEPMMNSRGQITQAVFVFTNMLRKLLLDEKPHYIAAVFESGQKTFRHEAYENYKSNRAEMPDDLRSQLPYIMRVCEAYSVPMLSAPTFEADDVIGTLAVQAAARGLQAVIVSNDKDMCQLVRDPLVVCMRNNSQNIRRKVPVPPVEWCDEAWVLRKFGVPAAQVIDLLGLMGDAVDSIPGAPGIGEKGAVKIITEFGSIENALANADKVTHKTYRESLQNNAPLIRQSRELATIHTSAPVTLDLEQLKLQPPNRPLAYALFRELEFNTLTREFADAAAQAPTASDVVSIPRRYEIIRRDDDLKKLVNKLWDSEHWAFSIAECGMRNADSAEAAPQTTEPSVPESLFDLFDTPAADNPQSAIRNPQLAIAISTGAGQASYVDLPRWEGDAAWAAEALGDVLGNGLVEKSVFDLKRAVGLLEKLKITADGVSDDPMLAAYLLDPIRNKYELNELARENIGLEPTPGVPDGWDEMAWRLAEAADFTNQVAHVLRGRLEENGLVKIYEELELPLAPLLHRMEAAGMRVDINALQELSVYIGGELAKLTARIYELAGREFNINSPKQVGEVFAELNIETGQKTATGKVSTNKAVLEELAQVYELPRLIIEYRELDKLRSVYTDVLPKEVGPDGRIHGRLNQTVAATGRLSSDRPNLQNIPVRTELGQKIRRAFIPAEGCKLVSADYSQIELRLLAHIARDPVMLEAFQKGEDIHNRTARLVFGARTPTELKVARRVAKIVNFGVAYAIEAWGLAQRTGLSRTEAKQAIADYYETYKGVRAFMQETPEKAREQGFVATLEGRRRPLPGINDHNHNVRSRAEREAINMPVQGCLPASTKVLTSIGYRPIGKLFQISHPSIQVWTGSCFAPFRVLNRGACELAELHLANGRILRCDTRHEVLVVTERGYEWRSYANLQAGDRICLNLPQEMEFGAVPRPNYIYQPNSSIGLPLTVNRLSEEFFYWLGYYFGDGWIAHAPDGGRWNLNYSFGISDIRKMDVLTATIERGTAFFTGLGLRPKTRWQSEQKVEFKVHSRGLIELLAGLGLDTQASAHTKRVPDFVFSSSLAARKEFLRGILAADGYAGANGATNPSIHLCQRELLEDLWLLFRTVGVESKIRGPYFYRGHVSYRLALVGGMLNKSLQFSECRSVKIPHMPAPAFIVDIFLQEVSPTQLPLHSHKVLHSRLKHGGRVSIYALAEMVKAAWGELSVPIYTWSQLREKRDLGIVEDTFTLAVDNELHRFDSEGVISKNTAADIVKRAMLRVEEALRAAGLKAKIVMQVHDELLVEAPDAETPAVVELLKREMENAAHLDVPLTVEVGVGPNWMDAK